jgi:L-amino acid N-acyltransferase YncA
MQGVTYAKETFPQLGSAEGTGTEFAELFKVHGLEVRGKPFDLDFRRYHIIEFEGRLVWIVARENSVPIGYACSFWYRDLHFNERVAVDDLWFVCKDYRCKGVGKTVKLMCHDELKKQGVLRVYDTIRSDHNNPTLMQELGFEVWGRRWMRLLSCQVFPDYSIEREDDKLGG